MSRYNRLMAPPTSAVRIRQHAVASGSGGARLVVATAALLAWGCATLGPLAQIVQPPRFAQADDQPAEIRLIGPSLGMPTGGAGVRIWLEVTNPNPFGFTLRSLQATLSLEGSRAATADFPLGLPLQAGQASVLPLDLSISFADVPGLAAAARRAASGDPVEYELDGTVGVDAGRLGTPTFGPMLLTRGELRVSR